MKIFNYLEKMSGKFTLLIVFIMFLSLMNQNHLFVIGSPNVTDLDSDISFIKKSIELSTLEADKHSSGVILSIIKMRIEIENNTLAMLEQKKSSFIRFIDLKYTIDGRPQRKVTSSELKSLSADIKILENKIIKQEKEINRYIGDLTLMTKLTIIGTLRITLAILKMRFLTARHGIPIFRIDLKSNSTKKKLDGVVIGKVVDDKDVL